jgi:DNA-binding NarL/FixJ family response regulator
MKEAARRRGLSSEEIAQPLDLSVKTVETTASS